MNQTKLGTEDNGDFEPQDLQEVVVDTSERLSDLISKGVSMELVDVRWILSVQMGNVGVPRFFCYKLYWYMVSTGGKHPVPQVPVFGISHDTWRIIPY